MKKSKTEAFKDEVSSNQRFQYIDDFPINLHSMKDIEDNQIEIENELENIFKAAFNKGTAYPYADVYVIFCNWYTPQMISSRSLDKDTRLVQKPEIIGFDESKKTVKFMSLIETSSGTTFHLTEQIGKSDLLTNY